MCSGREANLTSDNHESAGPHRIALGAGLIVLMLFLAPPAAQAAFGVKSFTAGVLVKNTTQFPGQPACDYADASANPPTALSESLYATLAGSHPYCGFTSFTMNNSSGNPGGTLADVRVDLPPGLVPDPQATPQCPQASFGSCAADTQVGTESLVAYVPSLGIQGCYATSCPSGTTQLGSALSIYNMAPAPGQVADFAFTAGGSRVDVIGGVRDVPSNGQPGDFGEYFTITGLPQQATFSIIPNVPLTLGIQTVTSTLVFFGDPEAQDGGASGTAFLTDPSTCIGPQTTFLSVDSYEARGSFQGTSFTTPVGASGCSNLIFGAGVSAPSITLTPTGTSSFAHDTSAGLTVDLKVPQQDAYAAPLDTPQVQNVSVTLPPGFTINPAAADSLTACSDAQLSAGTHTTIACPSGSVIGSASIHTPVLTAPLTGDVYLGAPLPGDPYRIFLDAEGDGLVVRLIGSISPNPSTGQLTTTFLGNPQVPFDDLSLTFNGGPGAVIASPLACGTAAASATLTPWSSSGGAPSVTLPASVSVDADGHGGACPSPPPFAPSVSTALSTLAAGAHTALTLGVARGDGQQYLSQINAQLPPGLLGLLASVPLCPEPAATQGTCPAASAIGTTTVSAGAGSQTLTLSGPVFLTGPYGGAPFGLSVAVPAAAGPYNLGTVVVRAGISVSSTDAHISIGATLPQIVGGIPLRVKSLSITVNRPGFLFNPTSCAALPFGGSVVGSAGTSEAIGGTLTATGCGNLPFAPAITASTSGSTSSNNGASLSVTVTQPAGGANLRSVGITLPKGLSARLSTVQQACPAATFAANPAGCPAGSVVGTSTAATPVLTAPLTGSVYLVSQGAAGLPTLNVVLSGSGITVALSGTVAFTAQGLTTSTFGAIPDVPISTFVLDLPEGPHSALAAGGNLCPGPLSMPAALVGQNGAQKSSMVTVKVLGCSGVRGSSTKRKVISVLAHRYSRGLLHIKLRVLAAGRISAGGANLKRTVRTVKRARVVTLNVPLTRGGRAALRRHHRLKLHVRLGFVPRKKGPSSAVRVTWTIRGT